MVTLDERLLNAPHSHLVGLMEGKENVREKGPVHLPQNNGGGKPDASSLLYRKR